MKKIYYCLLYFSFAAIVVAQTTTIERHGITWVFEGNVTNGVFVNGDPWIVGPARLLEILPETTVNESGAVMHGSMLNPSLGTSQGYDSRIRYNTYYPNLNIENALPLQLNAGSVIVSSISLLPSYNTTNKPQIKTFAVLTILAETPTANSFRPPVFGNDRTPRWTTDTLNLNLLQSLASVPGSPADLTEMISDFEYFWNEQNTTWTGRQMHAADNQPSYGREIAYDYGDAFVALNLDYPEDQKRELTIHLIQNGLDIYGAANAGGVWENNGGHGHGRKLPLLFAAEMLNDNAIFEFGDASRHFIFQEDQQTWYVTESDVGRPLYQGDGRRRDEYLPQDVGIPEWGEKHSTQPIRDGRNWDARYRIVVGSSIIGHILAARLMNLETRWNWPALFDYMDRFWSIEENDLRGDTNQISELVWQVWQVWDQGSIEDTTPPSLSEINVLSVGLNEATITWTTSEASTSVVDYGITAAYGQTVSRSVLNKNHSIVIEGLQADTTYYYRLRSADSSGNEANSGNFTFRTADTLDTTPPVISNISTDNVSSSGAVISWITNENTSSIIEYGVTEDYGQTETFSVLNTNHSITVANLQADTIYHYRIRSVDSFSNETISEDFTFVTSSNEGLNSGLIGYWNFDETSGTIASDSSLNGLDGNVSGDANWVSGRLNGALSFSSGAHVAFDNFDIIGNKLTLAAWIKPSAVSTDSRIIAKATGETTTDDVFWMLEIDDDPNGDHRLGFRINSGGTYFRLVGGNISLDQWTHVMGVYDGITMRLYQDGVEVATQAKTGFLREFLEEDAPAFVWVGDNPPDGRRAFEGLIDEVRVYNRALNEAEIALLMNTTAPILSEISVTNITQDNATITWTTDVSSTSLVDFDVTTSYGQVATTNGLAINHSVVLTGLQANTDYHFRVRSIDSSGNEAISGDFTFITTSASTPPTLDEIYIRDGASGDGSDWANALDDLPASLGRGKIYWIADGSYSNYEFDDPINGAEYITVRKANAANHGTEVGWLASYGDGAAEFGPLILNSDYINIEGISEYGIKVIGSFQSVVVRANSNYVNISYVELDGNFTTDSSGNQIDGACNGMNIYGNYITVENCDIHNMADDGIGIYGDNIKLIGSRIHNLHGCGTDGGCGPCFNGHSDGLELNNTKNVEIKNNLIYDIQSTGAFFTGNWQQGSYVENLTLENNIFYTPDTGLCVYLQYVKGAKVFNNVIWGRTQGNRFGGLSVGREVTDLQMYNNIILNINYSHTGGVFDASEHDINYNHFGMVNTGEYTVNTNDIVGDPLFEGIPMSNDPAEHLENITIDDFMLQQGSASIDSGYSGDVEVIIPSLDILNNNRFYDESPDRGVAELREATNPSTPTGLQIMSEL